MTNDSDQITNLADFVEFACGVAANWRTVPWWRGHADSRWKLVPSVSRPASHGHNRESNMIGRFKGRARTRRLSVPNDASYAEWLLLAQHHRLPTRLLDWTESPLVALYFACLETGSVEPVAGRVYVMDPIQLNGATLNKQSLPTMSHSSVRDLFKGAFNPGLDKPGLVAALAPTEQDIRMTLQHSAFTVHSPGVAIEDLGAEKSWLQYITVSAEHKARLLEQLSLMGIRRSTLFPDLESLAHDIAGLYFNPPAITE